MTVLPLAVAVTVVAALIVVVVAVLAVAIVVVVAVAVAVVRSSHMLLLLPLLLLLWLVCTNVIRHKADESRRVFPQHTHKSKHMMREFGFLPLALLARSSCPPPPFLPLFLLPPFFGSIVACSNQKFLWQWQVHYVH